MLGIGHPHSAWGGGGKPRVAGRQGQIAMHWVLPSPAAALWVLPAGSTDAGRCPVLCGVHASAASATIAVCACTVMLNVPCQGTLASPELVLFAIDFVILVGVPVSMGISIIVALLLRARRRAASCGVLLPEDSSNACRKFYKYDTASGSDLHTLAST